MTSTMTEVGLHVPERKQLMHDNEFKNIKGCCRALGIPDGARCSAVKLYQRSKQGTWEKFLRKQTDPCNRWPGTSKLPEEALGSLSQRISDNRLNKHLQWKRDLLIFLGLCGRIHLQIAALKPTLRGWKEGEIRGTRIK